MEHLENHPHAFLDENYVVENVILFNEHNSSLLEQVKEQLKAKNILCCCDYGIAHVGGIFKNNKFYLPSPMPSFVLNEETGEWSPPIPMPDSGWWEWDEATLSWVEVNWTGE